MRSPDFNPDAFIRTVRNYTRNPIRTIDLVDNLLPLTSNLAPINVFTHVVQPLVEGGYLRFVSFEEIDAEGEKTTKRGIIRTRRRKKKYLPAELKATMINSRINGLCHESLK